MTYMYMDIFFNVATLIASWASTFKFDLEWNECCENWLTIRKFDFYITDWNHHLLQQVNVIFQIPFGTWSIVFSSCDKSIPNTSADYSTFVKLILQTV